MQILQINKLFYIPNSMKKLLLSLITLFTIVALASCGNETTETKSDSTVVVDSTMCDSSTSDSTKCCKDTVSVEDMGEKK